MLSPSRSPSHVPHFQQGIALLEALIAILVFSIGVLGMIGLLGIAVKSSSDAKYRADAAYLANQVIARMWVDQLNMASYAHNAGTATCAAGGSATSAYATANNWLTDVGNTLPGASGNRQSIQIAAGNQVTVTVCWRAPQETTYHNYVATAQING